MSDSDEFGSDLDPAEFDKLDAIILDYASGITLPPRSRVEQPRQQQVTLFGERVARKEPVAGPSRAGSAGGAGLGAGGATGGKETAAKVRATKVWDPASFAKHGWSKKTAAAKKARGAKGKGKEKAYGSDEEPWGDDEEVQDDEDDGDEALMDPSYDPKAKPLPIKWEPDREASKTWVYPVQADKPLRVYQYNIVSRALFENTLVSLPTGLGKTFIAAVVMLNFYRWYPHGKIIFLAPSRPLVTQQIKACHYIAGIPQSDCVELTGLTAPKLRAVAWATKRVIYCTPQTVENDLAKGRLDPRDVTCLVVDEAHRATGDYAYCGVVRFLMSRNQHFRILALTATPGAKGEAVQSVIDSLHIGKIEVRTDESFDITQYIHKKHLDLTVVPLGPLLASLRDRLASLMQPLLGPLNAARLIFEGNPIMLSPFAVTSANGKIAQLPGGTKANGKHFGSIKVLAQLARAMEYLVIESVSSFEIALKDIESKLVVDKPEFKSLLRETQQLRGMSGYVGHPKMERLRTMCLEHFEDAEKERDEEGRPRETRVMVFCNFRAVVDEIVDCLNQQRPTIKATAFVGQSTAKGVRGRTQKDQIETIKKFKKGEYNVLVATSIGEEGLDIGEIDLIVCYEANKSPIRMLQRVGRTGRARDGRIIVLMTEGREEKNWDKAKDAYTDVQNALISNKVFELYMDGDRMLPKGVNPQVDKVSITALPLDITTMTMAGQVRIERKTTAEEKKEAKKQKKRDEKLNVPDDAFMGFRKAGQLASPGKALRVRKQAALLSVEEDEHLRQRWMTVGDKRVAPALLDPHDLPFERGKTGSALRIGMHSTKHLDALGALRTMDALDEAKPEAYDAWHDRMSAAFRLESVELWDRSARPGEPTPHKRIRRPPPVLDPLVDDDLSPCSHPSSLPSARGPRPTSRRAASPPPARVAYQRRSPAPAQTIYHFEQPSAPQSRAALDPFNVLTSSPELPEPLLPKRRIDEIVIDSDDDTPALPGRVVSPRPPSPGAITAGRSLPPPTQPPKSAIADRAPPPRPTTLPANLFASSPTLEVPDSDEEVQLSMCPPPPSVSNCAPALEEEDDDYSFFDLADEDLEACDAHLPGQLPPVVPAAGSANLLAPPSQPSSAPDVDDSILMPPPPRTSARAEEKYRKRPQHHRIPDSDSSSAVKPASQRDPRVLPAAIPSPEGASFDASPVVVARRGPAKRSAVVADTSSPNEPAPPVAGPSRFRPAAFPAASMGGMPADSPVPRPLNRLRRGRQVIEDDEEEGGGDENTSAQEQAVATKPRKAKKRKLTSKLAAKSNLFDFEAVNSSASGTEASSEAYSAENSDDRQFVASDDEDGEADSPGQHQRYRESLMTQAEGFVSRPGRQTDFTRKDMRMYPATPQTPGSPDQWSYDSFCAADDEEIEMESSSGR